MGSIPVSPALHPKSAGVAAKLPVKGFTPRHNPYALQADAAQPDREAADPMRRFAFLATLAMIFVRFSVLPEFLVGFLHVNTYLLYVIGPPAVLGCVISGGMGRAYKARAVWYWTGFYFWILLATPFSSWVGASFDKVFSYSKTDFICVFVIAGVVLNLAEMRRVFNAMTAACVVVLIITRMFAVPDDNGRLFLDFVAEGTLANSNDLAAHLVLMLPFLLYFVLKPGRNILLRLAGTAGIFYGLWVVLGTSSRGAMLGLLAIALLLFFRATGKQKIAVVILVPVIAFSLIAVLPKQNLARLSTIFGGASESTGADDEAAESMESRQYLLRKSIEYSFQHPLTGVGPSQFSNYEGMMSKVAGVRGNWHETHNTYTQISSECGIPALIFAMAGLVSVLRLVNKSYRMARAAGNQDLARMCLCYLAGFSGYLVCLIFLAGAYRFSLPAMIGMGVAIHFAANRELAPNLPAAQPAIR